MSLRGSVIPIIDLARKRGTQSKQATERSATIVAEVHDTVLGLVVDGVSDILTIRPDQDATHPRNHHFLRPKRRQRHRSRF
jgi:purine-binding chemotaxis protein CheW